VLPRSNSDMFIFLARRGGYATDDWQAGARHLQSDIEQQTGKTRELLGGRWGRCEGRLDGLLCSCNARPQKEWKGSLSSSCSRNAHDQNVLVRRAQSRINQATLENEMGDWKDARSGKSLRPHP
jgi:hypothetical protein